MVVTHRCDDVPENVPRENPPGVACMTNGIAEKKPTPGLEPGTLHYENDLSRDDT
jgi:hypothetical protein